ncbi:MAG: DUF3429 domain-containing protein [Rhodomicrobium sp.]
MTLQLDVKSGQAAPMPAFTLALAGLLPFVSGALTVCFSPESRADAAVALIAYGALILSFLGGIRWGFAILEGRCGGWGKHGLCMIPSLIGWISVLSGGPSGLLILALAFVSWLLVERAIPPALALPRWYMPFRGTLTAAAALSLTAAAFSW